MVSTSDSQKLKTSLKLSQKRHCGTGKESQNWFQPWVPIISRNLCLKMDTIWALNPPKTYHGLVWSRNHHWRSILRRGKETYRLNVSTTSLDNVESKPTTIPRQKHWIPTTKEPFQVPKSNEHLGEKRLKTGITTSDGCKRYHIGRLSGPTKAAHWPLNQLGLFGGLF